MNILLICIPYLVSALIGCGLLGLILPKENRCSGGIFFFLGAGVGLGVSAALSFINLVVFNHYSATIIVLEHAILGALLLGLNIRNSFESSRQRNTKFEFDALSVFTYVFLFLLMMPLCYDANFYPHGGWDAWSTWNFKARFLFLADTQWKHIFEPDLWRSSPHYPLFLPSINLWGWALSGQPVLLGPMITALIFCYLTAGLILAGIQQKMRNPFLLIVPLLIFSIPFCGKLAISQYSDTAVGYYLLAAFITLREYFRSGQKNYLCLTGLLLGFLTFTKQEGTLATMIIAAGLPCVLVLREKFRNWKTIAQNLSFFYGALLIAAIPLLLFKFLCSPGNQTFINGLTSTVAPATLERLKFMFLFLGLELVTLKWNGLWIFLLVAGIIAGRRLFQKEALVVPIFLILYLAVIFAYYFVNTRWEIGWWMQVSLHRILFTLLPTILFWLFQPIAAQSTDNP